jgi:hypothetical protein
MINGRVSARLLRFALPALLIVLVLAGLRGAAAAPGWVGRYRSDGIAIGMALEVLLGVLLLVLVAQGHRSPPAGPAAAGLHVLVRYLLTGGLVVVPLAMLIAHPWHLQLSPNAEKHRGKLPGLKLPPLPPFKPGSGLNFPLADTLYGLLVAVALAALVWCLVLMARHKGEQEWDEPALADAPDELRAAVESGRDALRDLDDARAAIIACYVAMEHSLAEAGAVRAVADTPDELLARAAAAGLVRGAAASRLTALFYEARFSTHPLEHGQRGEAERALGELAADLDLTGTAAAASGGAGTGPAGTVPAGTVPAGTGPAGTGP